MIREGMRLALDTQNQQNLSTMDISKKNTLVKTEIDAMNSSEECCADNIKPSVNDQNCEFIIPSTGTPLTFVDSTAVAPSLTKTYGILRKSQVPEIADRLKQVLTNFFPSVPICWNFKLKGEQFLAQVEDILIWIKNPEQPCPVDDLNKEGWKVYECSSTDLMFPRRLERGIRQIQRLGTKCRNV